MEIRRVRLSGVDVQPLLAGLRDEYDTRYGENIEMTRASEDEFDPPDGLFIVLMDGPITAAGGGFRRYNLSTCEVKRMWTSPEYRRLGLATRVLRYLEKAARETGYVHVVLETGPLQPEAEALYAGRGYSRIEAYGHYPDARAFRLDLSAR
jgi:GNAT superfamily N-acetyltransferase